MDLFRFENKYGKVLRCANIQGKYGILLDWLWRQTGIIPVDQLRAGVVYCIFAPSIQTYLY